MSDTNLIFDPISRNETLDIGVLELVRPGLTVYGGPMFSGKSFELIRSVDRIGKRFFDSETIDVDPKTFDVREYVVAFVPTNDTRFDDVKAGQHHVTTRGALNQQLQYPAIGISPREPWRMLEERFHNYPFVMIDEGNFWGHFSEDGRYLAPSGLMETVQVLVEEGREVYVAGLAADFRGEPFGQMGDLLAIADYRPEFRAETASPSGGTRTQRIIGGKPARDDDPVFLVGDHETYAGRTATEHKVPGKRDRLKRSVLNYVSEATED